MEIDYICRNCEAELDYDGINNLWACPNCGSMFKNDEGPAQELFFAGDEV